MVLPRNHPRDCNARGRKNSNLATLNRAPTTTKNSTNTVLVYSWPTPFRFHQWRIEMCDFVRKSCFIHWDSIIENHLHISGYHLTARNPTTGPHGGVSLYIKTDQITAWNHSSDCSDCKRHGYAQTFSDNFNIIWRSISGLRHFPLWRL